MAQRRHEAFFLGGTKDKGATIPREKTKKFRAAAYSRGAAPAVNSACPAYRFDFDRARRRRTSGALHRVTDIDLSRFTRDELVDLHNRIVDRLRLIDTVTSQAALSGLRVGQTVRFDAGAAGVKTGVLVKRNIKTATVLVGDRTWRVSPQFLAPADEGAGLTIDLTPLKD